MTEGEACEELTIQLDSNLSDRDISDRVNADSSDPGYVLLSDQDIIQQLTCSESTDPSLVVSNVCIKRFLVLMNLCMYLHVPT